MKNYRFLALYGSIVSVSSAFAVDIPKDLLKQRDPFKMPEIVKQEGARSELEMFSADQFKLLGILEGDGHPRAMVSAPNGRTYFIKEQMPIGQRKGFIRKITENAVFVREKIVNALGDEEPVETVLKLPTDAKQDVKTVTSEHGW